MNQAYTIVVLFEAKPGKGLNLKETLLEVVKFSRADSECLEFQCYQGIENSEKFIFFERWSSKEAISHHVKKPFIKEKGEQISLLIKRPYQTLLAGEI